MITFSVIASALCVPKPPGQNWLGKILMDEREALKNAKT